MFILYGLGTLGVTWVMKLLRTGSIQSDLDALNARKRVLSRFAGQDARSVRPESEPSYFDSLVRINVENLAAYYSLVKVHTDKSFAVCVAVGVIGFVLILLGLVFGFADLKNSQALAYVSGAAGIITEFISAVFFYLYNRTVRQMKGYHDSLLSVQNVLLSFKLVGDTRTSDAEKVRMVGQMLSYLIGKGSQPEGAPPDDVKASSSTVGR